MAKYHISPKTGKANICRAVKACPLGEKVPHFAKKEEAEYYIEEKLKQEYFAFKTASKGSEDALDTLNSIPEDTTGAWDVETYLAQNLNDDYTIGETIDGTDYNNSTLVTKDGLAYVVNTRGGPYSNYEVSYASRVIKMEKDQIVTEAKMVDSTHGHKEINEMLKEVMEYSKGKDYYNRIFSDNTITIEAYGKDTIVRDDGSEIKCFGIQAVGDRNFTDEPYPVETGIEFTENGEKQNARQMDVGYVIYDTRSQQGVLLKYRAASEMGYQNFNYEFTRGSLRPVAKDSWYDTPGDLYLLERTGDQKASYYKHA